jgi:hypothetical protein
MPAEKPENGKNDQFEFLFGKPPLLEGEDEERYLRLRAAVVGELEPKSVFDWINAKDQVDKLWEEERYKRAATALIGGGLPKALDCYLNEICDVDYAEGLSDKYFNGDAKGAKGGHGGAGGTWDHNGATSRQGGSAGKRRLADVRSPGGGP